MKTNFKDIAYTFIGIFYIVFFMMFIAIIDGMRDGKILIWYAIFAAWGTDICAYFVGKHFGKHKFSDVSPKKSLEGCLGGVVGSVSIMLIYTYFINKYLLMDDFDALYEIMSDAETMQHYPAPFDEAITRIEWEELKNQNETAK